MKKRQRPSKRDIEALCANPGPDDGLPPEDWIEPIRLTDQQHRKHQQLAGQIERTMHFLFSESNDPAFEDVDVLNVGLNVDGRAATITIVSATPAETNVALEGAMAWLRTALAAEIHRRRVPVLRFVVVPAAETSGGQVDGEVDDA